MAHRIIKKTIPVLFLSGLMLYLSGCYYDKEAELYPFSLNCDSTTVTYAATISPMMASNCNGCHSGASASAGVKTDNYNDLAVLAGNGKLWGSVDHLAGFKPMPYNAQMLSSCDLAKIRKWIDAGAPNN
jgi:mono/diheme cytochrome c family protein